MHRFLSKAAAILGAAALAFVITSCEAPSGDSSAFAGTYSTQDTQGNPMTITLSEDGSATGDRAGEALTGSWKEDDGGAAMITWSDEWTTKIAKDGDTYTKTAYKSGTQDGDPVGAEKVK
ncbi:MAG: hypothetical protein P8Z76_19930 [Alphaproteobacteria bacterium]|jgi:hypothetical protein